MEKHKVALACKQVLVSNWQSSKFFPSCLSCFSDSFFFMLSCFFSVTGFQFQFSVPVLVLRGGVWVEGWGESDLHICILMRKHLSLWSEVCSQASDMTTQRWLSWVPWGFESRNIFNICSSYRSANTFVLFFLFILLFKHFSRPFSQQAFWLVTKEQPLVLLISHNHRCKNSPLFKCPSKSWGCDSEPTCTIREPWNWSIWIESNHYFVYFSHLHCHVKMSSVKKKNIDFFSPSLSILFYLSQLHSLFSFFFFFLIAVRGASAVTEETLKQKCHQSSVICLTDDYTIL